LAVLAAVPSLAFGQSNVVNGLLGGILGGGSSTPKAGVPGTGSGYTPPLHGTNPHGQGSDLSVDILPSNNNPYPANPSDGDEEVVVGDSRGEQASDGTYHGSVTLAYLLGQPIVQVTTNPGQSNSGPLAPLQAGLDQICTNTTGGLCLTVLGMNSSTTSTGSTNSFQAAGAEVGGGAIEADLLTSHGNISSDGTCQTAHGDSTVAFVNLLILPITLLDGSSTSTACNNGTSSTNQSSHVVTPGPPLPPPLDGCVNGTPNSTLVVGSLLALVCNANDVNNGQTSSPYGVREGLTGFLLLIGNTALVKATLAGPESHAVAPPPGPGAQPGTAGVQGATGKGKNNNGGGNGGNGGGPVASTPGTGNGSLAFTGADLIGLGLVGGALILGGLVLTGAARRHRRTA
jgi:hypothetical protein